MFTGIIESMASVKDRTDTQLIVGRPAHFDDIRIGSSIAVSGVCLSIVDFSDAHMTFDVIDETWSRSNFVSLQEGDKVNLERAMKASDRLEGHIVQGHCEVSAEICNRSSDGIDVVLPEDLLPFVVVKGSITLDGVSLTVAALKGDICSVALIPLTLERTTLGIRREGECVNVETDILIRHAKKIAHCSPAHAH
ncbi:MAG: riboflavin synthase [bacterium]|nr:riboflavin synthase [bacterium]